MENEKEDEIKIEAQCEPVSILSLTFLGIFLKAIFGGFFYSVASFFTKMWLEGRNKKKD